MFEEELKNYPDLMSPEQVANLCQCSKGFIRREIARNNLKSLKISRKFRIPKKYLIEYLEKQVV